MVSLGPDDYDRERSRALSAGRDLSREVKITHFFSATGSETLPTRALLEAEGMDEIIVDEELAGDGFWHIAAFTTLLLSPLTQTMHKTPWSESRKTLASAMTAGA